MLLEVKNDMLLEVITTTSQAAEYLAAELVIPLSFTSSLLSQKDVLNN
jgi:hypothetical protein